MTKAEKIVNNIMFDNDAFSKWLGIEIIQVKEGYCKLSMQVTELMLNGFNICHGGITYSLADSALAFASNTFNKKAVSIETSISHTRSVKKDDMLMAESILKIRTSKTAIYEVVITNQHSEIVALFKGTVFIKDQKWIEDNNG